MFKNYLKNEFSNFKCRIILPQASWKPVSYIDGEMYHSWFDIYSMSGEVFDTLEKIYNNSNQRDID